MKTVAILSTIALALPAFAAPAPAVTGSRESGSCPNNNKAILTSNNNESYKVLCGKDLSTKVIRIIDTEVGIQGCLTACDGTVDCDAVTFVSSNHDQTKGTCYSRKTDKAHKAGSDTAVAIRVSGGPTTTISTWPTAIVPTSTVLAASTTSTSSAASATATSTSPLVFGGISIRSGSDIQYASVNANGTNFYLNRGTSTYCPAGISCSNQTNTLFVGGNNTLSLGVVVPGGQQVYVDSTGALRYTVPHSANTGVNSTVAGFSIADEGLHLQFEGNDFVACPVSDGAYEVYAATKANSSSTDCLGFAFRIAEAAAGTEAAWEYA